MQQNESEKRQLVSSKSNKGEILLDENLPKSLWKALQAAGYPTARLGDEVRGGKPDSLIFRQVGFRSIIITLDKDYLKTDLLPIPHSATIEVSLPNETPAANIARELS